MSPGGRRPVNGLSGGLISGRTMDPHVTPTFAGWLRHVFAHPITDSAWYWDLGADTSEPASPDCVAYLTRLFEEPEVVLAPYSEAQVDQGLWYLVDSSCSDHMFSLTEPGVAWPLRHRPSTSSWPAPGGCGRNSTSMPNVLGGVMSSDREAAGFGGPPDTGCPIG
jgi:hypothetical protein